MCGIAGLFSTEKLSAADHAAVREMTARLVHRGPDDSGFHFGEQAALGHRRLAIIDLHSGRQPIANEDESVFVVANAEVYNFIELREELIARGHRFRTASDCECLVHLYEEHGAGCVEPAGGMFAFAIWDARTRTAILARDRLGVKPLYYHLGDKRLAFGSELKAVLAAPGVQREIDPTALVDYLTYGFIPSPKTIFRNIFKLPPATILCFRNGRITTRAYWDLHAGDPLRGCEADVTEEVWEQLREATRRRMLADVPVGAFLSAGVDSAAVVAAMAGLARGPVDSVTCGFDERSFDERDAARETARILGTRHHELVARPDADAIAEILCRHFDEPFADASAIPTYYLSREARRLVTVALSGDGGDESLAGYRRYRFDGYEQAIRNIVPHVLRRTVFGSLGRAWPTGHRLPRILRAKATLANIAVDAATGHGQTIATMEADSIRRILGGDLQRETASYEPLQHAKDLYNRCDAADTISKCQYVDLRLGLADGILTKVDRASMANALEVRSPMLDYRWVELAWRVPVGMRIRGLSGKHVLRKIVAKRVGEKAAKRRKTGFEVPLDAWFDGPLKDRFRDEVLSPGSAVAEWLAPEAIRRIWSEHLDGGKRNGPTLWKLLILEAWARMYLRGTGPAPANRSDEAAPQKVVSESKV